MQPRQPGGRIRCPSASTTGSTAPAHQGIRTTCRSYSASAVERLRYIQLAQALGFTLDALRVNLVSRAAQTPAEIHDDLLQRLDTRLVEIDQMLATLRAQRKDLLSVRAQMEVTWAAGDCLNPSGVKLTPAEPAVARARARARGRWSRR